MKATAIILGRGGSKGLPRKNLRPIAGKPCVLWTIEAARAARQVETVAVSSDDGEMLELARAAGCVPIERPAELASDTARVDDAARHAMGLLPGEAPLVILYANVPVRPEGCIDRALDLLGSTGADSVQSYQPVGKHHPWWTARVDAGSGRVRPWEGEVLNHGVFRRQDLPAAHLPDGAVIALTRRALALEVAGVVQGPHAFFGSDRRGIVNPEGSVVDIDDEIDLRVAEAMLTSQHPIQTATVRERVQAKAPQQPIPRAYFITFRTYGTWLPGDERGSQDDELDQPGTLSIVSPTLEAYAKSIMNHPPMELGGEQAAVVERTIREVCRHRRWAIDAIAVRSNHVHVVVRADVAPERVMNEFKTWSTRRLRENGLVDATRTVWARHGSTKYLWDQSGIVDACAYVEDQGPPLK